MAERQLKVTAVFDDQLTGKLSEVGKTAGAALAGGLAVAGAAVAGGLGAAISSASEFTAKMAEVKSLGLSDQAFAPLTQGVSNLAAEMGLNATDATKALYDAISAGQDPAHALEFLATAGKAAVAGITDMSSAGGALSVVMNSFGPSVGSASHVADVLFQTVKQGVTTFPELASSIGNVSGLAASMGVSFEESASSIAQITTKGQTTAGAVTQLRAAMTALSAGGKDMTDVLSAMGFSSGKAAIQALGLQGTFEGVRAKADQMGVPLAKVFGSVEAVGAVLNTTGANAQAARDRFATFADVAGNVSGAFETINQSASRQFELLKSKLAGIGRDVGMALLPAVGQLLASANQFLTSLGPMVDVFRAQIGPLITTLTASMGMLWTGFVQLAAFLSPVLVPALAILAGMIGLTLTTSFISAAASGAVWFAQLAVGGVFSVVSFIGSLTTLIPSIFAAGAAFLTGGIPGLLAYLAEIGVVVPANFAAGASFLAGLIPGILSTAAAFFTTMIPAAVATAATFLGTTVPSVLATGAAFVAGLIPALAATVASVAATALGFLAGLVPALVAANASLVATIAGAVATAATFLTTTLPSIIATAAGFLVTLVPAVWAAVTSFLAGIIPAAIAVVGGLMAMIPAAIAAAGGFLSLAATALVGLAGVVASAVAAGIGVLVGLWPIILVAGLIGLAIYMVYKNWGTIWGAIVKFAGAAAKAVVKGISWLGKTIWDVIKKALGAVGKAFKAVFGGVLKVGKEFVVKLAGGVRKGIASMATKVMGIIEKLGTMLWDGLKGIVDSIISLLKSIPGVDAILTGLSSAGSGVKKFVGGFKGAFDKGGDEAGGSFVDSLTTSIDAGLEAAGIDFSVKDALGEMMPEMPGAAAGGGGGAAAAEKDPAGIWSGTDSKGAWTIDPATGAKIYDAGSVGALQQQNAASDKAAKEAGKQAKDGSASRSGVGAAVEKNIAPKESIDLSKAFSEAVQASIAAMASLVGARIPSPDQYMPKLEQVRAFWLDVGNMFASIYRYAAETDRGKAPAGALIKSDLEGIGIGADAMDKVFKSLESVTGFMGKLSDLKKLPTMEGLAVVREFALAAVGIGREIMGLLDKAAAEILSPVADALGKTVDVIGKIADVMAKPIKAQAIGEASRGAMVDALRWIGGIAYELTAPLMDKADESIAALNMTGDVMKALGAGVDMIGKLVSLLGGGIGKVKAISATVKPAIDDAIAWIGGIAYSLSVGLMADSERNQVQLNLANSVFASLGAGMDMITKAVALLTGNINKLQSMPLPAMEIVEGIIAWVGQLAWRLTAPLLADIDASLESLKMGKEAMGALSVGLDLFTKAATLKVKASAIADDAIATVVDNVSRIVNSLSALASGFFDADGTMKQAISNLAPFSAAVGVAVELFSKAASAGFDKVTRLTADTLSSVGDNIAAIVSVVSGVADIFVDADGVMAPLTLAIKSFTEQASAAVDLFVKAAGIGVEWDKATAISASLIFSVSANINAIVGVVSASAAAMLDAEGALLPIVAAAKVFADSAGEAVDLFISAAAIGVEWDKATLITADTLYTVNLNLASIVAAIVSQARAWSDADGKLLSVVGVIKDFADAAGAAVGLVVDAAGASVDWARVSVIPADKLSIVSENIAAILAELKGQLTLWTLADGTLDPVLAKIKEYAETSSAAVELVTKGASLGQDLADTVLVTADMLNVAGQNIKLALDEVMNLAKGFDSLDEKIREDLFKKIKSYSESATTAVELILKGAGLSEALQNVKPIGRKVFEMVAEQIKFSIEELARLMSTVGADVADDARKIAETAGPVADAIGKALDAFSLEKMLASGFIDAKVRSGPAAKAAQTRAQAFANNVKAGIKLMFDTLRDAMSSIGGVDAGMAAHIQNIVAAYTPIITLIEKLSALKWDMRKIREFATIPGLLGWGITGGGGAAQGGGGSGTPSTTGPGGGILLTGPATITGPVTFQGTMAVNVMLDGSVIQRTLTSGTYNRSRQRHSRTGAST